MSPVKLLTVGDTFALGTGLYRLVAIGVDECTADKMMFIRAGSWQFCKSWSRVTLPSPTLVRKVKVSIA